MREDEINTIGVETIVTKYSEDAVYPRGELRLLIYAITPASPDDLTRKSTHLYGSIVAFGQGEGASYGGYVDFSCGNFQKDNKKNLTEDPYARILSIGSYDETDRIYFTDIPALEGMCDKYDATQEQLRIVIAVITEKVARNIS